MIAVLLTILSLCSTVDRQVDLERFLHALRAVESVQGTRMVGDGGRARGWYHIHRAYWLDGVAQLAREGDRRLTAADYPRAAMDEGQARRVVLAYFRRYAARALAAGQWEVLARVHNGGPAGHLNPDTLEHWRRVQGAMR